MRLLGKTKGRVTGGEVLFNGENLLNKNKRDMQRIRGKHISMVFQEPMTSLNPVLTIGDQITETLLQHEGITKEDAYIRGHASKGYDSDGIELQSGTDYC